MDNEQGLSCGCSPGDLRFKSESFSWAWGVLRTPPKLLAVVTPRDEESGVPLVSPGSTQSPRSAASLPLSRVLSWRD